MLGKENGGEKIVESPNTNQSLQRFIDRKKLTQKILGHKEIEYKNTEASREICLVLFIIISERGKTHHHLYLEAV